MLRDRPPTDVGEKSWVSLMDVFNIETGLAIIGFFVVIGPLVFFHELGHFLAARWFNIKVEEFGIGFPPRMVTLFEQAGTKFTLNWIPLGGFMRPIGEDDPSIPGGLASASRTARFTVLAAGPGANILLSFILLVVMYMIGAPQERPGVRITLVEPGSPAAEAGLLADDIILVADGMRMDTQQGLVEYIGKNAGKQIELTVERNGASLDVSLVPRVNPPENQGPTGIRIEQNTSMVQLGLAGAMSQALREMAFFLRTTFVDVPTLVFQQAIEPRYLRPSSVVGISQISGQFIGESIRQNALFPIFWLTAYISLALAVTNLLPIPALDGGRILFVLLEAIRGQRIDPRKEMVIHFVGFAVLMVAMVVFVYLDIVDPLVESTR